MNSGHNTEDKREDSAKCVSNNAPCDPERSTREWILKEVGLTSAAFIGPALPPVTPAAKSDIEETLNEFYKELEKITPPDAALEKPQNEDGGYVQSQMPPERASGKELKDSGLGERTETSRLVNTDDYQENIRQKHPLWPHWYNNEPYYPRRPRLDTDLRELQYSQRPARTPEPRHLRPPPFHVPKPPPPFPYPQNLAPHSHSHSWSGSAQTNHYKENFNSENLSGLRPPNVCSSGHLPQDFHTEFSYHSDKDDRVYDALSDNVNVSWRKHEANERSHLYQDYDWRQENVSENELWERQYHSRPPDRAPHSPCVLILMRGLPGSGKSTLARELLSSGPSGLILSTDDYFAHNSGYRYDPGLLGAAHEWNQRRAIDAMYDFRSPIIIDNTNIQAWEMKPYVKMALERGYRVDFCEPDTKWKFDPLELERRNKHGVPQDKIAQMLDRFSYPISVDIVMSSQDPPHVHQRHQAEPQTMRKYQH